MAKGITYDQLLEFKRKGPEWERQFFASLSVEPCPFCTCQGKTPVCINGVCRCFACQELGDNAGAIE